MRTTVTMLCMLCLVAIGIATPAWAQEREDVLWARFTDEEIVLDGVLNEAAWQDAETVTLTYGENAGLPGSGWFIETKNNTELEGPTDRPPAQIKVLAKGDSLYIAYIVADSSIGGSRSLWNFDGLFFPTRNISVYGQSDDGHHHFNTSTPEFMLAWWNNVDTTDAGAPMPGIPPTMRSHLTNYGEGPDDSALDERTAEQEMNWEMGLTVNGTVNDDSGEPDEGFVVEMRLNMAPLGYDLDKADGEIVEMGFNSHDADWYWPNDPDLGITTRTWFQAKNGNNLNEGSVKVHTDPSVTVDSATLPSVQPDVTIMNGANYEAPVVDGILDEAVWEALEPAIRLQYQNEELIDGFPGMTKYQSGYFRPDASDEVPVLDPSLAAVEWFFKDNWLYVGIDVDDQTIDTTSGEGGDGFRFALSDREPDPVNHNLPVREFIVTVGPDGEPRLEGYFAQLLAEEVENAFDLALSLKGSSTPADPTDVDEGYQIEMAINLVNALNYPEGLGDHLIFPSANLFDKDIFEDATRDYRVVTWWARERNTGPGAWGVLDADALVGTASEELAELPGRIELLGNYPNPFNPTTTIRYALPATGEVTVQIFDLLGREVVSLAPGWQVAGQQQIELNGGHLSSGVYFYRVKLQSETEAVRASATGRIMLVK